MTKKIYILRNICTINNRPFSETGKFICKMENIEKTAPFSFASTNFTPVTCKGDKNDRSKTCATAN